MQCYISQNKPWVCSFQSAEVFRHGRLFVCQFSFLFFAFFLLPAASFSNGWNILMAPSVLFPSPVVFNQQPQISCTMDGSPSSFRTCRLRMIFSPGHDARCLPLLLRLWPSILHNKCGVNYLWLTYFITCSRRIQSNRVGFGFHTVVYKGTPTNASSRGGNER